VLNLWATQLSLLLLDLSSDCHWNLHRNFHALAVIPTQTPSFFRERREMIDAISFERVTMFRIMKAEKMHKVRSI
jgi:hypothetical protein